jgi:hypothetical protein
LLFSPTTVSIHYDGYVFRNVAQVWLIFDWHTTYAMVRLLGTAKLRRKNSVIICIEKEMILVDNQYFKNNRIKNVLKKVFLQ